MTYRELSELLFSEECQKYLDEDVTIYLFQEQEFFGIRNVAEVGDSDVIDPNLVLVVDTSIED